MDVLEAIRSRRASRAFQPGPVAEATIKALLEAATWAPSARNTQPWRFAIIERRALLDEISQATIQRLVADPYLRGYLSFDDPAFDIFYGAPVLVVICARRNGFDPVGDCYLAAENLMLAAHAMGLATCPVGLARETLQAEPMRRTLSLPENVDPVLPIAVGHARKQMAPTVRAAPVVHAWIR